MLVPQSQECNRNRGVYPLAVSELSSCQTAHVHVTITHEVVGPGQGIPCRYLPSSRRRAHLTVMHPGPTLIRYWQQFGGCLDPLH